MMVSCYYIQGYQGRFVEIRKLVQVEIQRLQMEEAARIREQKRLEKEAEEERKRVKREYMREYRLRKKAS